MQAYFSVFRTEREREREREKECVCVWERERECVCVCVCGKHGFTQNAFQNFERDKINFTKVWLNVQSNDKLQILSNGSSILIAAV